tara:strand:+ start:326 stop:1252 length:927 start_codon:yes stop_codon:yes gene_type:complete
MINICSLSDKNYFRYGMALYDSLIANCEQEFTLHYLCMDDETYDAVSKLNLDHINLVRMQEIEKTEDFKTLKENTVYNPSGNNTYCWAMGSFFSEYLVSNLNLEDILYVDSDICFYNSIDKMYEVISSKSIAIMLHRHNEIGAYVGAYNVGVIYFKNDDPGYKCLKWWRDCVITPNNQWAEKYGTCGDQKYLEAFGSLFGDENICIIDEEIGHGAPWNMGIYKYLDNNIGGKISWTPDKNLDIGIENKTREQDMYFVHFAQFTPDYENQRYRFDRDGAWCQCGIYDNPSAINYYNDYFLKTEKYKDLG